jgi:hypothetical protein
MVTRNLCEKVKREFLDCKSNLATDCPGKDLKKKNHIITDEGTDGLTDNAIYLKKCYS